jgi:hypothetical protein
MLDAWDFDRNHDLNGTVMYHNRFCNDLVLRGQKATKVYRKVNKWLCKESNKKTGNPSKRESTVPSNAHFAKTA